MRHKLLIFMLVVLMMPLASAMEWDNVKSYDSDNKIYTIKDSLLGIPTTTVATLQLKTPQIHYVVPGKNRLVYEIEVDMQEDNYEGFIKNLELINNYNSKQIEREINWKYKSFYDVQVDNIIEKCFEITLENETKSTRCENIIDGKKWETRYDWVPLEKLDFFKGKTIIGGFTDVYWYDNVEWYIDAGGQKLTEWATWTSGLSVGLQAYWRLNETGTATTAVDATGNYDLTVANNGNDNWVAGKLSNGYFTDTNDNVNSGYYPSNFTEFSINYWINATAHTDDMIFDKDPAGNGRSLGGEGEFTCWTTAGTTLIKCEAHDGATLYTQQFTKNLHEWYMITLTVNNTGMSMYVNGTKIDADVFGSPLLLGSNIAPLNFFAVYEDGSTPLENHVLDEIAIYNRTLTPSEISDFWNSGAGLEYNPASLSVTSTLSTPVHNTVTTTASQTFICNSSASNTQLNNISYHIWNSTADLINTSTIDITGTTNSSNFPYTLPYDDAFEWNCFVTDITNVNDWGNTNFTITLDTTAPTLTPLLPVNNDIIASDSTDFNYSASDAGVGLDTCWYSTDAGVTNTTFTSCGNTTATGLQYTDYSLWYWANDSANNILTTPGNRNFTMVNISIADTYVTNVTETMSATFTNTVNHSTNVVAVDTFHYNTTAYGDATVASNVYTKVLTTPMVGSPITEKSFLWEYSLTYNGNTELFNTTTRQQSINQINITDCNGNDQLSLNFSYLNESSDFTPQNATQEATFHVWKSDVSLNRTFSFDRTAGDFFHDYCVYPNWSSYTTDAQIVYTATGYDTRHHFLNDLAINNVTQNINLYMMGASDSTDVIAKVQDGARQGLSNYIVQSQRYYPSTNTWSTVEVGQTDDFGYALFHLVEKEIDYKFLIHNSTGSLVYSSNSMRVICTDTPCIIEFTIYDEIEPWENVGRIDDLSYTLTWTPATSIVAYTWTDSSGATPTMRLEVEKLSGFVTTPCDTSISAVSGTLNCNLSSYSSGDFLATAYKDSEEINTLQIYIDDIEGTYGLEGVAWSLLLLIPLIAVGLWNPVVAIGMAIFGLIIIQLIGIMAVPLTITMLVALVGLIIMTRLRT